MKMITMPPRRSRAYALAGFHKTFAQWVEAMQEGDAARAARYYDDQVFLYLGEIVTTPGGVEAALDRWIIGIGGLRTGLRDFDASGSLSYASIRVVIDAADPAESGTGMFLVVMSRHGRDWKIRSQTLVMD